METKLHVQDLRISFRTSNGKVQAVRGISFDLAKGETLAIVGESGSGKSVTSKAILGIQAGNAITESGEIIYDGQDLLKINEEAFHKIRGDKIAMIFQDPMSSLNPIVKIGKQLTEAMILKGKARQRESKELFDTYIKALNAAMLKAVAEGDAAKAAKVNENIKNFQKFEFKHIELEGGYRNAFEAAQEALDDIKDIAFEMEKDAVKAGKDRVNDIVVSAKASINKYVVDKNAERVKTLASGLNAQFKEASKSHDYSKILPALYEIQQILTEAVAKAHPDFYNLAYYLTFSAEALPEMPIAQLDAFLADYMSKGFMGEFTADMQKALEFSANASYKDILEAIDFMQEKKAVFQKPELNKAECMEAYKVLAKEISETIDPLAITKDSMTYTFAPSLLAEINTYFTAIKKNVKAQKVHDKDQKKYDRMVASGKTPDWTVAAAATTDLELVKSNIVHLIDRLCNYYRERVAIREVRDYAKETEAAIHYIKTNAAGIDEKVTHRVAKARAIKLMEEVGIAEPHKRYGQYPFEFSGGMRQRIVIAIALAANPDILICDEPTTALDVTIQSQILELINKLKRERELSVIFITHDLGVVANMADRVAVMYAGKVVEIGTAEDIFYDPKHPYTWALLSSMPDLDTNEKLEAIPGTPPNMIYPPVGDAFAARNKYAMQIDFEKQPPEFKVSDTHYASTWLLHPDAPKVDPPKTILDRIARMKAKRGAENAE